MSRVWQGVVFVPGRIVERRADGTLRRESPEPAPPLLDRDQAVRLLLLDARDGDAEAQYHRLRRLRIRHRVTIAHNGMSEVYPLEELLGAIERMKEEAPLSGKRARRRGDGNMEAIGLAG